MSQLEELKNLSFQSCGSKENEGGGGVKVQMLCRINIQINYNLLSIDPQVLL